MSAILSHLTPKMGARKRKVRVGRGRPSGHGKTSGRGGKGQTARTGGGTRPHFEGGQNPLVRRIPKRGFSNAMFTDHFELVNLSSLGKLFKGEVTVEGLVKRGLVSGRWPVKILAEGELKGALTVKAHAFSKSAKEKIEKAGGKAELVAR